VLDRSIQLRHRIGGAQTLLPSHIHRRFSALARTAAPEKNFRGYAARLELADLRLSGVAPRE
jgi:hypothetical protein